MSAKDDFLQNVSRETFSALEVYEETLWEWQKRINLVADSTMPGLWNRHFVDSYQLVSVIEGIMSNMFHVKHVGVPENQITQTDRKNVSRETFCHADLGSGAGFPGMVLALAGIPNVNLIESDQRKCAFLREVWRVASVKNVSRETFCKPTVHNARIENVRLVADIITSRAFADLAKTLDISHHLCHQGTQYILLKPLDMEKELTEATKYWYFDHEITPSASDQRGCVLRIYNLRHK